MKYTVHTEPDETIAMIKVFSEFLQLMDRQHQDRMKLERDRFEWDKKKVSSPLGYRATLFAQEEEEEEEEEDILEEKPPMPSPPILAFERDDPPPPNGEVGHLNEHELTDHQKLGKKLMGELLETWLLNWGGEGQQPNRFEALNDLARHPKKGGALVSYCMAVRGLTIAVHNALGLQEIFARGEEAAQTLDQIRSRAVAANITQVASCVFSQLADQYHYPDPLKEIS